tara:strand:- start:921 stop:1238 length:318 start_codon:yes stop_codon:yes gene_type:complete
MLEQYEYVNDVQSAVATVRRVCRERGEKPQMNVSTGWMEYVQIEVSLKQMEEVLLKAANQNREYEKYEWVVDGSMKSKVTVQVWNFGVTVRCSRDYERIEEDEEE